MQPTDNATTETSGPEVTDPDVVVIGGGPAGAATAAFIAQGGRRVVLLEREGTPRFKVGESLLPGSFEILERLGVVDTMRDSHFPKKYSVQFFSGSGRASSPFYFSETEDASHSQTWQVLRQEFDGLLLDNARRLGVDVRFGVSVKEILFENHRDGDRATGVRMMDTDGTHRDLPARVVVDATGQRSILARQLGLRTPDPCLRMAAVFTHFEGAHRDEGIDEGATLIMSTEGQKGWFWYIPLPENRVSVGVVGPIEHLIQGRPSDPQQIFDEEVERCPAVAARLEHARQAMDVKVLNDFSYSSSQLAGDGWMLVGDAFCFLDPIYSSGVFLALSGAELAAEAILTGFAEDDLSGARRGAHEPRLRHAIQAFRKLVYSFYTPEFNFSRFLKCFPEHRGPIIKILVGDVFDRDFSPLFRDLDAFMKDLRNAKGSSTLPPETPLSGPADSTATALEHTA